jgi:hypothetical protein
MRNYLISARVCGLNIGLVHEFAAGNSSQVEREEEGIEINLAKCWRRGSWTGPLSSVGAKAAEGGGKRRQIRRPFHSY